jgi:Ca2+-binding EF-hand superfamily protein
MIKRHSLQRLLAVVSLLSVLCCLTVLAPAQDFDGTGKAKKAKGDKGKGKGKSEWGNEEDAKLWKMAEKAYKQQSKATETVRAKVVKELRKSGLADADQRNPDDWFTQLTGGADIWRYDTITHKPYRELFERIAAWQQRIPDTVSRQEFNAYAQANLHEGASPAWKAHDKNETLDALTKMFRDLDRNRDGVLDSSEAPERLRSSWSSWDMNRDGVIDLPEYAHYAGARVEQLLNPTPVEEVPIYVQRERVYGGGQWPDSIPRWLRELDDDRDGQIGLYEWYAHGLSIPDYRQLDANDDGFITTDEWFAWATTHAAALAPTPPPRPKK